MKLKELLTESAKIDLTNVSLYIDSDLQLVYAYISDEALEEALENYDMEDMEEKVLFSFGIKDDLYFSSVSAKKGYGPLAYMVAMQLNGKLSPYPNENKVTPSAQKVWKEFFDGKGASLVSKKLVGEDEKNYRDYEYSLKKKLNLTKSINAHKKLIGKDHYGERKTMMDDMAESALNNLMNTIYTC